MEHVKRAERLCTLLNREGANVRRMETAKPSQPLWEDDVQVVTRRPRMPPASESNLFGSRVKARVAKQRRRRLRAGRIKVRARKSGI
jgi:hypothetical protein